MVDDVTVAGVDAEDCWFSLVVLDSGDPDTGILPTIRVHGKVKQVCTWSLFVFSIHSQFRQKVIWLVEWWWFDKFILFLILLNSILLSNIRYREDAHVGYNFFFNRIADPIFTGLFAVEFLLKVIALGLVVDQRSYLRDAWNCLDLVVVISSLISFLPGVSNNLGFLRVFRVLKPLRGLSALSQIKVLVRTMINCIPNLGGVVVMAAFFYTLFGIVGVMVFDGVFYRRCRTLPAPLLAPGEDGGSCWSWPYAEGEERYCGGRYMCASSGGFCGGHDFDPSGDFRPRFPGGQRRESWCPGSEPAKLHLRSYFVHFDHMGGALLAIFQCMTLEGWTEIMYDLLDASPLQWAVVTYFLLLIPVTSFFLLNITLAAIDSVFADEQSVEDTQPEASTTYSLGAALADLHLRCGRRCCGRRCGAGAAVAAAAAEEEEEVDEEGFYGRKAVREGPWLEVVAVRLARRLAFSRTFTTVIMLLILANVVIMTFEAFPADLFWEDFMQASNTAFLWVFTAEMAIMLVALGPRRYCTSWLYTFDGTIVLISWLEAFLGASPVFRIARAVRIVLKINKFARSWARLDSMLKAMWATTLALKYWLVLFLLALYICTLMGMSFFANMFHFDADGTAIAPGAHWCPGSEGDAHSRRQDCIPRAHFDTFLWAFVTVFQVMTGENWNSVMYDAMNATSWVFAAYFVWLILFGQVLVLSLFLSVLMSQFMEARVKIEELEAQRRRFTRFKTFIVFRVTKELAKLGTRTFQRSPRRSSPRRAERGTSTAWCEDPGSSRGEEATAVSRISVRPRTSEAGAEEKDVAREKPAQVLPRAAKSTITTKSSVRSTQGRSARLRLVPRPDDPEPDSELIASTFLEALGAPQTAPPEEEEDEGASGGSGADTAAPSTPSQSEAWEPPPCLRSACRRRDQLREAARWLLALEVRVRGEPVRVVESVVFVCIMLSTLVTIFDNPLRDPDTLEIRVVRGADAVFSVIFTVEILTKLVALGPVEFFTGPEGGWNRLDAVVVLTSMLGLLRVVRGGAFRIVRIIRAIRPLRIISRAPTLRIVVQTVLSSMPGLVTLILGSLCCMLVFALLCITILKGRLHHCENPDGRPLALSLDVGKHFTTPLCLRPNFTGFEERWTAPDVACANGAFEEATREWLPGAECPTGPCGEELSLAWRRASPDTPICVGRCDPHEPPERQPPFRRRLCPRRFERLEELPSACPAEVAGAAPQSLLDSEAVGQRYVRAMRRELVLPCGGSSASAHPPAAAASCRAAFCPGEPEEGRRSACRAECGRHPTFCSRACEQPGPPSAACLSCREECEAACQCREFCEPLVRDAALCREQGLRWSRRLSQHFDNFGAAMLSLFEISTTEGWVDLMYAAADIRSEYMQPRRDAESLTAVLLFCLYIFLTNIFLLNLSVGLIVDNFIGQKQDLGGRSGLLLTEAQQRWVDARKALYSRRQLFNLWDLHLLPKTRRKVYDLVSSQAFELFIMIVIALNILCLAMKVFPAHMESWPVAFQMHWNQILDVCNLVAGSIFLVEFLLKLYALQKHYWTDGLNVVDFLCLVTTGVSMLAGRRARSMLGNAMRIARCVRLVGFFQELKRLFRALILTLPKLANVMLTFLLLLIMYGILGVNLFAASKHSEEHAANGNFRNFFWAFLTLFRASTGEAWNEIMHDLGKSEQDHFREGGWCAPLELFDTSDSHSWSLLQSKCLLDNPNACASSSIFHPQMVSALYWVSFTMIITFLFMNLLLAVIIDSYQDCKQCPNAAVLDLCFTRWKRHDPDHRASLPLPQVMAFIHEVVAGALGKRLELPTSRPSASGIFDLSVLPMRYAQAFSMRLTPDGRVHYLSAFQQVLRFVASECNLDLCPELDAAEAIMGRREAERLRRIEQRRQLGHCSAAVELRAQIAVVKLQRHFRNKVSERRARRASTVPANFRPASVEPEAAAEPQEERGWELEEAEGEPEERGPFGVVPAPRTVRQHHSATLPSGWLRRKTCSPSTTVTRLSRRGTDLRMEDLESLDLPSLSLEPRFFAASTSVPDDLEEEEV